MKKRLNYKTIPIKKLAILISSQLKKNGIEVVLTGGACVTIYTTNEYQSMDLDFVANGIEYQKKAIKASMEEIGFKLNAQNYFARSDCPFFVEFLPPPLSIGKEPVKGIKTIRSGTGILFLLSPTECVKDRLAGFYFWDDMQSLEQAKMVSKKHKINFNELARWSKIEGKKSKYDIFLRFIGKKAKKTLS
ncbi:hypothetical protein HZC34_04475 [Candidatus Saganbacteria bacterium]|nr:hypothetical protein [Candidatus Saganbacteria bacterium]